MNIRPKIYKFQNGTVPQWYIDRYGGRTALKGWDLNQRYNYSNENLNKNDHRNAGDLNTVFRKNHAYTITPGAITSDIQAFYDSDGNGMSAEDFVNFYNKNAAEIRGHWNQERTYNASTAGDHNRLFRRMFKSRSDSSMSPGSDYNIGYQEGLTKGGYNIEDIEGSSTWLRRMDQYENEFDPNNPDSNRVHTIKLKDGTFAQVYKKANGDIALLPKPQQNTPQTTPQENQKITGFNPTEKLDNTNDFWNKLSSGFKNIAPDLLSALRYAGNMHNNERVYNEMKQAIIPNLQQTYHTHRQVVGDEATKQAYYRRATQGQTKAAQPFTSDADRQMAYQMETKRIGDELRAQGDLADNQEIRRTSDESNQHQWANTQRDTELANSNLTELIKARAALHQLNAQKYSADWTNTDQYLMGWESKFKQKQAEEKALNRQLALLDVQGELLQNDTLSELRARREKAYWDYIDNKDKTKTEQLKKAFDDINKQYQLADIQAKKEMYRKYQGIYSAKTGTKITKKDTSDKYLYRTSRDIVEHFRRMSKMTDDSRIRTMSKPIKLSSHPRKMQLGGVAPFTIYRPLGAGGETTTQTSTSTESKSTKDTAAKDKLDMIKELFKQVQGLPIDVSKVYQEITATLNKAKAFGEDLSSDDIASMYLNSMNRMAQLKYSAKAYEQAHAQAVSNEALNEIAVGSSGELILQDRETGEVKRGTLTQLKDSDGKLKALTNSQLLEIRAHSPNLAFDDDVFSIVNNGIGISKIAKEIKNLAATIGSSEQKLEGVSEIQGRKIKAGLQTLAGYDGTPDGFYKITQDTKSSKANVQLALNYIYNMLPTNYKVIMKMHSGSEDNSKNLIAQYLTSQTNDFYKEDVAPLTGKAAQSDKDKTNNGINSNLLDQIQKDQIGVDRPFEIITKDGNTKLYSLNSKSISQLPNVSQDMSLNRMLSESKIGTIMDSRLGITFGDQVINPENFKDIMFDSTHDIQVVTLPCKYQNGHKVVNFAIKDEFDDAIKEASKVIPINYSNPEFIKVLSQKLHEKGLDSLLKGNNIDPNMFGHFMVVSAYTTDKVNFDTNSRYIEKVKNPDSNLEDRIIKGLSTNKDKNDYELDVDDKFGFLELTYDDVYRGNVFIPLNNDPVSAQTGWGGTVNLNEARTLAEDYQNFQKSSKQKDSSSSVLQ